MAAKMLPFSEKTSNYELFEKIDVLRFLSKEGVFIEIRNPNVYKWWTNGVVSKRYEKYSFAYMQIRLSVVTSFGTLTL